MRPRFFKQLMGLLSNRTGQIGQCEREISAWAIPVLDWRMWIIGFAAMGGGCNAPVEIGSDNDTKRSLPAMVESLSSNSAESIAQDSLREKIRYAVENNLKGRMLVKGRNAAWQVIHGAVAYGVELPLEVDGDVVPALGYLFSGGELPGWDLMPGDPLPNGRRGIRAGVEAGSYTGQGHVDQFLGYMSQTNVPLDSKIVLEGETYQLEDWVRQAQMDVSQNPYREYSWTLIALTNYFPKEETWIGTDGNRWALETFVEFEAKQDLTASACGGMHRLMGLAHAVRFRERNGGSMEGGWLMAKNVVDECIRKAEAFQNSDGTFSTQYTKRPANSADMSTRIGATGHTLEFLAYALPESRLSEPWVEKSVNRLCELLKSVEEQDLECGGIYHTLAGLRLYSQRRYEK